MTANFADYEFDVSEAYSNKATLGTVINGKRAFLSGFTIEYATKPASVTSIKSTESLSALKFDYSKIDDIYSYTNTAIRFGGLISKSQWDALNSEMGIEGYGILVAPNGNLGGKTIKQIYAAAKRSGNTPEETINSICSANKNIGKNIQHKANPTAANDEQKSFMGVSGDYYIWTVKKTIGNAFATKYNAVAFILVNDNIVFLDEVSLSAKDIAASVIPQMNAEDPALPALTWIQDH